MSIVFCYDLPCLHQNLIIGIKVSEVPYNSLKLSRCLKVVRSLTSKLWSCYQTYSRIHYLISNRSWRHFVSMENTDWNHESSLLRGELQCNLSVAFNFQIYWTKTGVVYSICLCLTIGVGIWDKNVHLTIIIIPRVCSGYEVIDSQRSRNSSRSF